MAHYWDPTESRMMAVEYSAIQGDSDPLRGKLESWLATLGRTGKHAQVYNYTTETDWFTVIPNNFGNFCSHQMGAIYLCMY